MELMQGNHGIRGYRQDGSEHPKHVISRTNIEHTNQNPIDDGHKLYRDYGVTPAGLLELSHLARLVDPARVTSKRMISLRRIVEMYTGFTLAKGGVRTSNWEACLDEEQLECMLLLAPPSRVYSQKTLSHRRCE